MDQVQREQVALFRYQVIAPLLSIQPGQGRLKFAIQSLAGRTWDIPFSLKRRINEKTIEQWYYRYKRSGLDGLLPAKRHDAGRSRKISPQAAQAIEQMLHANPKLSATIVLKELIARGITQPNDISLSTYYRFRKVRGLDKIASQGKVDRKAFSFEYPNECWQSDMLFGPHLAQRDGGRKRSYLFAILDDCTRIVCHAQFYLEQHLSPFLDCLKQALMKRGVPQKLYVDNGKVFRSRPVLLASAQLGMHVIHSRPRRPQGRGKIERWFRTVRSNFLSRLDTKSLDDLDHLNHLLWAWIEGEYHQEIHKGIKEAPIDKWIRLSDAVQPLPMHVDLDKIFFHRTSRRVKRDGTFQLKGKHFEAGVQFIGEQIQVLYNPFDLRVVWIRSDRLDTDQEAFPLDALANRSVSRRPDPPKQQPQQINFSSLEHLRRQMHINTDDNDDDNDQQGDPHAPSPCPS